MAEKITEKVNIVNAIIVFIGVIIVNIVASPDIVSLIMTQSWGATAVTILAFLAGLFTRFYKHDGMARKEPEKPSEE